MKKLRALPVTLLVAAVIVSLAATADARLVVPQTWEHLTLITTDGWEFPDVTIKLIEDGRLIRVVRDDGAQRTFEVAQIRELQDSIGRDVTAHVIPGWSGSQTTGPPPITGVTPTPEESRHDDLFHEVARPVDSDRPEKGDKLLQTRFAAALGAGVGYGRPYGNWFEGYGEGESYHASIRLAITGNFYVVGGYRYQRLPWKGVDEGEMPSGPFAMDLEVRQMTFGIGLMPRRSDYRQAIPFLEFGMGRASHRVNDELPLDDGAVDFADIASEVDKRLFFVQAGILMPLGRELALELGVGAVNTGRDLLQFDADADGGTIVSAQIGLTLLLGQVD